MGIQTLNRETDSDAGESFPADGWLLEQFIREKNEAAFAKLMERHGPYILGVCRRVTQHVQDAEDVFQACFLELARNASAISQRNSVAGWLQTVAVRMGRKVRARRARRDRQEATGLPKEPASAADDLSWREIRLIVEEQLARLPIDLRLPVILCLFEGRTQEDAARHLNIKPRTLKDRLGRGREMLRARLTHRGVSLSALGALLSGSTAAAAVCPSLQESTLRGAVSVAHDAAPTAVISPSALVLTVKAVLLSGWPMLMCGVVALLVVGRAGYVTWNGSSTVGTLRAKSHVLGNRVSLHSSFRNEQFDARVFQWTGPRAESYSRRERNGLRLTLPDAHGPAQPVGIMLRYPLRGDFEIEATWEIVRVKRPASGWGVGATVYCFMDSADWEGVWFGKMIHPDRGPEFSAGLRYNQNEKRTDKFVKTVPAEYEAGFARLRVVRKGAAFNLFVAEQSTNEFRLLETFEASTADATIVRFAADPAWSPDAAIDVRLVDVSITAEGIVGYVP